MDKTTKFPSALISGDCTTSSLRFDGGGIIDQCIVTAGESGTFFWNSICSMWCWEAA